MILKMASSAAGPSPRAVVPDALRLAVGIGGGATPYLIKRGYIEVMVDIRGSGD
jgi:predicted acyl esterase